MRKTRFSGAIVGLALLAAGCDGIGDGSKLESLRIAQDLTKAEGEETSVTAYTCLPSRLILVGTFSEGDAGDFAFRARWSAEPESVLKVANYGDPVEGRPGEVYTRGGVILPQGVGDAVVTAEYQGFTATMPVVVKATEELRIVPGVARIVPKSAQKFVVRAKVDGADVDVTSLSELSFVDEDAETFATVGEVAQLQLVTGVAQTPVVNQETGQRRFLTLKAGFDAPCPDAPTSQVAVQDIPALDPEGGTPPRKGLILDYEEDFSNPVGRIAERTSSSLQLRVVFGDFDGDGKAESEGEYMRLDTLDAQQGVLYGYDRDSDGQCELLLEDNGTTENPNLPTALTFGSLLTGLNTMTAVGDDDTDDRSTVFCASFGAASDPDGDGPQTVTNGTLSNVLPITIVDAKLDTLVASVSDPCTQEAAASTDCEPLDPAPDPSAPEVDEGTILRIKAQGTFVGGYSQDITKNVIFMSDEPKLAAVGVGGVLVTAADITAVKTDTCPTTSTSCTATITATWNGAVAADNKTTTLTIKVNAVPDEEEGE